MRKVRSVTIGGKRHRVVWRSLYSEGAMGFAHPDQCLIEIDPDYDELAICDTLVHEFLHRHPATRHLEEDAVNEMGTEIATMLHKMQLIATEDTLDAEA
jgi:hypothetical protein